MTSQTHALVSVLLNRLEQAAQWLAWLAYIVSAIHQAITNCPAYNAECA